MLGGLPQTACSARTGSGCCHLHPIPVAAPAVTAPSAAAVAAAAAVVMNLSAGNHARNEDFEIQRMPNERAREVVERYDIWGHNRCGKKRRTDGRGSRRVGVSFQNKISSLHARYILWCMAKGVVTHLIGLEKIKQRGMQLSRRLSVYNYGLLCTGMAYKVGPRFCEIKWENCVLLTYCRQAKAIFLPHFHTTWYPPLIFRPSLYCWGILFNHCKLKSICPCPVWLAQYLDKGDIWYISYILCLVFSLSYITNMYT